MNEAAEEATSAAEAPRAMAAPFPTPDLSWRSHGAVEPVVIRARDVMSAEPTETRWAVAGLLAEGVTLLVGAPKLGKSWLALSLSIAVASGAPAFGFDAFPTTRGEVLYLALEDGERRLRGRLYMQLGRRRQAPARLHFGVKWDRFGEEDRGLQDLATWILDKRPSLVVVDTWAKVMPATAGFMYGGDYSAIGALKGLADATSTPVVLVHHQRKSPSRSGDPLETIAGSQGLVGSVDNILILDRERGEVDGSLYITGRDVEEATLPLTFDPIHGLWNAGPTGPEED